MKTKFESIIEKLDVACPIEERPDIAVGGEALTKPIIWHRKQWAVTEHGLEARDGTYPISADQLWKDEKLGGWVQHMTLKNSTDSEDFIICLAVARLVHKEHAPANS
jgi:hypothetical protein